MDCLRGIAAIGVMFFHFSIIGIPIANHGYLAVDLFFMLSGFVMSHAYYDRLNRIGFYDFVKMRLIRIMPLSILGLLFGTVYFLLRYFTQSYSQYSLSDILVGTTLNIFLVPKLWITPAPTDTIFATNTPLWSLSLELFINFMWASFIFRFKNHLIALLIILSAIIIIAYSLINGSADVGATWPTYVGGVARAIFGFFMGFMLWKYRPIPNKSFVYSIISAVTLIVIIFSPNIGPIYDIFVVVFVFPYLIYTASSADYRSERKIFNIAGNLSYPLYVIHVPILMFLVGVMKLFKIDEASYLIGTLASITCIASAIILDLCYDRPIRSMLNNLTYKRRAISSQ